MGTALQVDQGINGSVDVTKLGYLRRNLLDPDELIDIARGLRK